MSNHDDYLDPDIHLWPMEEGDETDDDSAPEMTTGQEDRWKALSNQLFAYNRKPAAEPETIESIIEFLPDGDFDYSVDEAWDWHVYRCGEKDCPQQWHLAAFTTSIKRSNGKLEIEIMDVDESGNWDFNCGWETGDDWLSSGCAEFFGKHSLDSYFQGWAEYWLDAAITGEDPCDQCFRTPPGNWVDFCLDGAASNINYLTK